MLAGMARTPKQPISTAGRKATAPRGSGPATRKSAAAAEHETTPRAAGRRAGTSRRSAAPKGAPGTTAAAPAARPVKAAAASTGKPRVAKPRSAAATVPAQRTDAERDRAFRVLLHTACLKAGTAAVITTLTTRVPLLNRMAPALVGSLVQSLSVARIQHQLVLDILALYGLELSELEQQGVMLLATAANVGAQELSRRTVQQLVARVGRPLDRPLFGRPMLDRMLPVTNLVAENAAAIASTYAVGRRAQALCRLSGTGARDLGELLGTLTGIDQRQLAAWSVEAVKLALHPFRSALGMKPLG